MTSDGSTAAPGVHARVVHTPDAVRALEPAWAALVARCPDATPFQSPAWLIPWWESFPGEALRVAVVYHGGQLVALGAFYVQPPDAAAPDHRLLLLGAGNSDYLDVLVGEDAPADAATRLLAAALADEGGDATPGACHLGALRATSPLLTADAPRGWHALGAPEREAEPRPVLPLPPPTASLTATVPARMLARVRYYERRASAAGHVTIETADAASLDELLAALVRLHGARWRDRGEPGVLADTATRHFLTRAAPALLRAGHLRLSALRLDGVVVAAHLGFQLGSRAYYYLGGFDPTWERIAPGTLLLHRAIERARATGAHEFDLLRGAERYKYRWGAHDRPTFRRVLQRD